MSIVTYETIDFLNRVVLNRGRRSRGDAWVSVVVNLSRVESSRARRLWFHLPR